MYLKKGYVYLIPVGLSYGFGCDNSMEQLYFHLSLVNSDGYDLLSNCKEFFGNMLTPEEGKHLISLYKGERIIDSLTLKSKIYDYIIKLLQNRVELNNTMYSLCVQKAIAYINQNLSIHLNISMLAQKTFVSTSSLTQKFKNETGISIGKYIDNLIIFKSEQLLMKSNLSIRQISELFGFCDQFYFSRKFKDKFKMPPQEYRNKKRFNRSAQEHIRH